MRRKSERNKNKSSPEKKIVETPTPPTRKSKRHSRRHRSPSEDSDDVAIQTLVNAVSSDVSPEVASKSPSNSEEEKIEQPMWKVKTADSASGEIQKIKICLTRPTPTTPERREKSPRRRRHKSGAQDEGEERSTRKSRRRGSSAVSNFADSLSNSNSQESQEDVTRRDTPSDSEQKETGEGKLNREQIESLEAHEIVEESVHVTSEPIQVTQSPDDTHLERIDVQKSDTCKEQDITDDAMSVEETERSVKAIVVETQTPESNVAAESTDDRSTVLPCRGDENVKKETVSEENEPEVQILNETTTVEVDANVAHSEPSEDKCSSAVVEESGAASCESTINQYSTATEKMDTADSEEVSSVCDQIEEKAEKVSTEIRDADDIQKIDDETIAETEVHPEKQTDASSIVVGQTVSVAVDESNDSIVAADTTATPVVTESGNETVEEVVAVESVDVQKSPDSSTTVDRAKATEERVVDASQTENDASSEATVAEEVEKEPVVAADASVTPTTEQSSTLVENETVPLEGVKENVDESVTSPAIDDDKMDIDTSGYFPNFPHFVIKDVKTLSPPKDVEELSLSARSSTKKPRSSDDSSSESSSSSSEEDDEEDEDSDRRKSKKKATYEAPPVLEQTVAAVATASGEARQGLNGEIKATLVDGGAEKERDEPVVKVHVTRTRPRTWTKSVRSLPESSVITTESIRLLCPNVEILKEEHLKLEKAESRRDRAMYERKVSIEHRSVMSASKADEENEKENANIIAFNRKISIVDDEASKLQPPPQPAKNPVSSILFLTNLVRPFTLKQLKELLCRTGAIVENGFWTDRIKSKCYVHYENLEDAEATRNALHGVQWPIGNGKKLDIDYATEEKMEAAKSAAVDDAAPPKPVIEKENSLPVVEEEKKEKPKDVPPIREWDLGKMDYDKEKRKSHSRERDRRSERERSVKRRHSRHSSPADDFITRKQRKKDEEVPAKLMDDLFHKTTTTPSIYWLPLTPEQIATKQQERLERMAEHKRRMDESRGRGGDFGRGGPFRRR